MKTLYRASRVHTLSHPPSGEWVLVDGRHIERVGSGAPPAADRVVDLPATTIVPGFIDSHVHLTGTGVHDANPEIGVARSAEELVSTLAEIAAEREGPTLVHGYDETKWANPRVPTLPDLDAASRLPLIVVRADGHVSLANTPALSESGALEADGVERGPGGEPTGRVTREANRRLRAWWAHQVSDRQVEELQLRAAALAASRGVTCVHEMSMPAGRGIDDLRVLLDHRGRLPVDVVPYLATTDIPQAIDLGLGRIGGDLTLDGSIGARTASLSEPYVDRGDVGIRYLEDDELAEFFHDAHLAGLQVGVHAIGDRAIEQAIGTWERVYGALDSRGKRHFRARRHRIEHFEMPNRSQLERAGMLGVAVSVQPAFDAQWGAPGQLYDLALGWERAATMNPFRDLLGRGLVVGVGTDAPITDLDPIATLDALEGHHDPGQRLSREEALRLATIGSARLSNQEDKKGSLEPGMHADFAVYEADPLGADRPPALRPVMTVSLGREVFAA
ncbi:MAG TPA: amidohydrolase [Actinomycetota bacterium]|nr:amidohydrolase [Actinomycetota bacterium]